MNPGILEDSIVAADAIYFLIFFANAGLPLLVSISWFMDVAWHKESFIS